MISVSVPATNSLLIKKSERYTNDAIDAIRTKITKSPNDVSMHKNLLSCNLCSWLVLYTDYSCSLDTIHELQP
jgi:hypothetical protein